MTTTEVNLLHTAVSQDFGFRQMQMHCPTLYGLIAGSLKLKLINSDIEFVNEKITSGQRLHRGLTNCFHAPWRGGG
eukprot:5174525-Amphidinium_carterae.1